MRVTIAPLRFWSVPIDDGINPHHAHFGLWHFQLNQEIVVRVDFQIWRGIYTGHIECLLCSGSILSLK